MTKPIPPTLTIYESDKSLSDNDPGLTAEQLIQQCQPPDAQVLEAEGYDAYVEKLHKPLKAIGTVTESLPLIMAAWVERGFQVWAEPNGMSFDAWCKRLADDLRAKGVATLSWNTLKQWVVIAKNPGLAQLAGEIGIGMATATLTADDPMGERAKAVAALAPQVADYIGSGEVTTARDLIVAYRGIANGEDGEGRATKYEAGLPRLVLLEDFFSDETPAYEVQAVYENGPTIWLGQIIRPGPDKPILWHVAVNHLVNRARLRRG